MWPYMGSMGWWMVLFVVVGIAVLVLLVRRVIDTLVLRSDLAP